MKTIVENLNELIDTKGGDTHGATIAQCLSILNEIEATAAAEADETAGAEDSGEEMRTENEEV